MANKDLYCDCGSSIIKSYSDEVKMRAKVVKWTKDGMFAVCKSCGKDVPVSFDVLKAIQSTFVYEVEDKKALA